MTYYEPANMYAQAENMGQGFQAAQPVPQADDNFGLDPDGDDEVDSIFDLLFAEDFGPPVNPVDNFDRYEMAQAPFAAPPAVPQMNGTQPGAFDAGYAGPNNMGDFGIWQAPPGPAPPVPQAANVPTGPVRAPYANRTGVNGRARGTVSVGGEGSYRPLAQNTRREWEEKLRASQERMRRMRAPADAQSGSSIVGDEKEDEVVMTSSQGFGESSSRPVDLSRDGSGASSAPITIADDEENAEVATSSHSSERSTSRPIDLTQDGSEPSCLSSTRAGRIEKSRKRPRNGPPLFCKDHLEAPPKAFSQNEQLRRLNPREYAWLNPAEPEEAVEQSSSAPLSASEFGMLASSQAAVARVLGGSEKGGAQQQTTTDAHLQAGIPVPAHVRNVEAIITDDLSEENLAARAEEVAPSPAPSTPSFEDYEDIFGSPSPAAEYDDGELILENPTEEEETDELTAALQASFDDDAMELAASQNAEVDALMHADRQAREKERLLEMEEEEESGDESDEEPASDEVLVEVPAPFYQADPYESEEESEEE